MGKIVSLFNKKIKSYHNLFELMRIKQYVKNLLIFAPAFFASQLIDIETIKQLTTGFIGFSLITSFVYIINDIKDAKADQHHPIKCKRPLAAGLITTKKALSVAIISLILGLLIIPQTLLWLVLIYISLNLLYSYKIKHYALIDVITIALMYIIRLFAGSIITNISLSHWIVILTFLTAMFLAISKRYDDLKYKDKNKIRSNIHGYKREFIENTMSILASIMIVAYIMYTISPDVIENFDCEYVYITSVFVLIGVLRYLQLTFVYQTTTSPTQLLYQDKFLQLTIISWVTSFICIIYL